MTCVLLAISFSHEATGAGYYLPNQDAFATARGNAFVATADNPSAVFYNPAGMTQLDSATAQIGVYSIVLGNSADVLGQKNEAKSEIQSVPSIFYVKPLDEKISFGFGLNSPFGLGTDWGRNTNISPLVTETRLAYLSATFAAAYKATDDLSFGASLSLNRADLTLERGLGVPGSFLRFEGADIGFSAATSALWQPTQRHSFGMLISTGSEFDLKGKTFSNGLMPDSSSELDFMVPARIAAGYSFRPAPGWNIEANVEWLDWDSLNSLTLDSSSVGGSLPIDFDWQSSFIYELGVSYTTLGGYVFAAGYDFNANSQPDRNFTPAVSDANMQWLNIGVGHRAERSSWMLTYQFGFSERVVDGATNPLANGRYEPRHNAIILTWQWSL